MQFLSLSKRKIELFDKILRSKRMDFDFFIAMFKSMKVELLVVLPIFTLLGFIYAFQKPNIYKAESKIILLPQDNSNGVDFGNLSSLKGFIGMNINSSINDPILTFQVLEEVANSAPLVNEVIFKPLNFSNCDSEISYYDYLVLVSDLNKWDLLWSNVTGEFDKYKVTEVKCPPLKNTLNLNLYEYNVFNNFASKITVEEENKIITISLLLEDPVAAKELLQIIQDKLYDFATEIQMKDQKEKHSFIEKVYLKKRTVLDSLKNLALDLEEIDTSLEEELEVARDLALTSRKLYESSSLSLEQSRPVFHVLNPPQSPNVTFTPSRKSIIVFGSFLGFVVVLMLFGVRYFVFRIQHDEN